MRTPNVAVLPEGYRELRRIDLQKNKRLMLFVNLLALVIAALLCVAGHQVVPVSKMFDMSDGIVLFFVRFGVMLGGTVLYIVLHEAVHGIFFRIYGNGVKPTFGFTGMYAFAASKAYFNRVSYLIIGLSPVVILGAVLLVLNLLLPAVWFWPIFFIQITNLSGAAGDFYVSVLLARMPSTLLVQDDGVAMTFYVPSDESAAFRS